MDLSAKNRMVRALTAFLFAMSIGTLGFWLIESGKASLSDCLYMTIITLSTVGYGEVIPLTSVGRAFASVLIIFGMGTLLYFASTVVALWVEIDMSKVRRRRKMKKTIIQLSEHIIVCGVGATGSYVVRELEATRTPFVMIDSDEERILAMVEMLNSKQQLLHVVGDATEDRVLEEAGIERARGLVATLRDDKDNVYITLSARQLNPKLRIIARAVEKDALPKILRAGADQVVSPNLIGGMRIASEMIRPEVVEFLDMMMRDMDKNTRIEQVSLPLGSLLAGKKLSETNIRKTTDVLVIAIRDKMGKYIYNPGPEAVLTTEATLIVLGAVDSIIRLRKSICGATDSAGLIIS